MSFFLKTIEQKKIFRLVIREFKSSWWVLVVLIFTAVLYTNTSERINFEIEKLLTRHNSLESEVQLASLEKSELLEILNSLKDPEYVEMVLIDKLSVTPEDCMKIRFNRSDGK